MVFSWRMQGLGLIAKPGTPGFWLKVWARERRDPVCPGKMVVIYNSVSSFS